MKEGQKLKSFVLLPTAYTAAKSVLCCQTHALTWLRCSVDPVFMHSNRISRCKKYYVRLCISGASRVGHKGEIELDEEGEKPVHTSGR
jgi:hypothetical protein